MPALPHKSETIRELRPEEVAALFAFAQKEGRTWKAILREGYWYNARIWRPSLTDSGGNMGALLHALRNDPRWSYEGLEALTFANLEKMARALAEKDETKPPFVALAELHPIACSCLDCQDARQRRWNAQDDALKAQGDANAAADTIDPRNIPGR